MLSLASIGGFFLGPIGRWVGLGLALLTLYGVAFARGAMRASASCQAEALRAENGILKDRLATLESLATQHAQRVGSDAAADHQNRTRVDATPKNDGRCLDRDAARRVRSVR